MELKEKKELMIETSLHLARKNIEEGKEAQPTLVVSGSENNALIYLTMPESSEERQDLFLKLGERIAKEEKIGTVEAVCFLSEAYMSVAKKDEEIKVMPSKDPKRKEVLIVAIADTVAEKEDLLIYDIDRKKKSIKLSQDSRKTKGMETSSPLMRAFYIGMIKEELKRVTGSKENKHPLHT